MHSLCPEYDNAAVVQLVNSEPRWHTTPERVHITADLAVEAVAFIETAYRLSPGCRADLVHGDLITTTAEESP